MGGIVSGIGGLVSKALPFAKKIFGGISNIFGGAGEQKQVEAPKYDSNTQSYDRPIGPAMPSRMQQMGGMGQQMYQDGRDMYGDIRSSGQGAWQGLQQMGKQFRGGDFGGAMDTFSRGVQGFGDFMGRMRGRGQRMAGYGQDMYGQGRQMMGQARNMFGGGY
jgi:hypothetical protein